MGLGWLCDSHRALTFDLFVKYRAASKCACTQAKSTEFPLVIWVKLIEMVGASSAGPLSGFPPGGSSYVRCLFRGPAPNLPPFGPKFSFIDSSVVLFASVFSDSASSHPPLPASALLELAPPTLK